jgi:protein SCO1/2
MDKAQYSRSADRRRGGLPAVAWVFQLARLAGASLRTALASLTLTLALSATLLISGCSRHAPQDWQLSNVDGHLPDLRFSLVANTGQPMNQDAVRGKIAMVFFGYTHCPDICPTTMAKLTEVLKQLGPQAADVRVLFISVDPARDTPATMNAYVDAFDPAHAIGLTGTADEIETLAKRYRVAYAAERRDTSGNYEITHSGAVYLFDKQGHARLIASIDASDDKFEHDLRLLLSTAS